jgi:hypothetical protein
MGDLSANTVIQLHELWKEDAVFDKLDPSGVLAGIGALHAKYLRILTEYRLQAKAWERKLARLKKVKWEYYNGKMDQAALAQRGWTPFPFVLKADIHTYMEADADIQAFRAQQDICEEMVEVATAILKALNNRTWEAKEYCGWEKFMRGA